ncbi:hypothetical protein BGX26_004133 [Mortierella sp. AD094]|nr:hypothetical protein BGX26_004133 [Mortierella sp. AD094]
MMLVKASCIIFASICCFFCVKPPPHSKEVNEKKKDKIVNEDWLANLNVHRFPIVLAAVGASKGLIYLLLMMRGDFFLLNTPEIMQLREVKPWHFVATALCFTGLVLRRWSFITLGRFFTYQLTIRPGHLLVQSGPYKFLRHPSYTGAILCFVSFHSLIWNEGLFEVCAVVLTRVLKSLLGDQLKMTTLSNAISIPHSLFGVGGGNWLVVAVALMLFKIVAVRVKNEEAMLKEHFGTEWELYASKRWLFIPLVY